MGKQGSRHGQASFNPWTLDAGAAGASAWRAAAWNLPTLAGQVCLHCQLGFKLLYIDGIECSSTWKPSRWPHHAAKSVCQAHSTSMVNVGMLFTRHTRVDDTHSCRSLAGSTGRRHTHHALLHQGKGPCWQVSRRRGYPVVATPAAAAATVRQPHHSFTPHFPLANLAICRARPLSPWCPDSPPRRFPLRAQRPSGASPPARDDADRGGGCTEGRPRLRLPPCKGHPGEARLQACGLAGSSPLCSMRAAPITICLGSPLTALAPPSPQTPSPRGGAPPPAAPAPSPPGGPQPAGEGRGCKAGQRMSAREYERTRPCLNMGVLCAGRGCWARSVWQALSAPDQGQPADCRLVPSAQSICKPTQGTLPQLCEMLGSADFWPGALNGSAGHGGGGGLQAQGRAGASLLFQRFLRPAGRYVHRLLANVLVNSARAATSESRCQTDIHASTRRGWCRLH